MNRIIVIGTSCSGKSTFSKELALKLTLEYIELDALHWLPDWVERDDDIFTELVQSATETDNWVIDGNYGVVRQITWNKADTIIWLNYPFFLVFFRALKRTLRRMITHEQCCGNNKESFRLSFFSRNSILLWVLTSYHRNKRDFPGIFQQPEFNHLQIIILQSPKKTEQFLQQLIK